LGQALLESEAALLGGSPLTGKHLMGPTREAHIAGMFTDLFNKRHHYSFPDKMMFRKIIRWLQIRWTITIRIALNDKADKKNYPEKIRRAIKEDEVEL
jgi:hypothetical protein